MVLIDDPTREAGMGLVLEKKTETEDLLDILEALRDKKGRKDDSLEISLTQVRYLVMWFVRGKSIQVWLPRDEITLI